MSNVTYKTRINAAIAAYDQSARGLVEVFHAECLAKYWERCDITALLYFIDTLSVKHPRLAKAAATIARVTLPLESKAGKLVNMDKDKRKQRRAKSEAAIADARWGELASLLQHWDIKVETTERKVTVEGFEKYAERAFKSGLTANQMIDILTKVAKAQAEAKKEAEAKPATEALAEAAEQAA